MAQNRIRKAPKRYQEFYALAQANGLPNPHGRALYAVNASLNGRLNWGPAAYAQPQQAFYVRLMRHCKPATAAKWAAHFAAGNSLKSLCHGKHGRKPANRQPAGLV